jgi:predicted Zn-dependent peptidase
MSRSGALFALMGLLLLHPPQAAAQSAFAPRGLYDVETLQRDNGLRVYLKQRRETRNVAFRLVVGLGTRQFDCRHRETPHLLEHLLFSGTSHRTEDELERAIEEQGGSWNAETGTEYTIYQLDIFDQYALNGLDMLYEIMTNTVINDEKVGLAKSIIYREEGGRPGVLRRLLYRAGLGKTAWNKADAWLLPGEGAVCPGLVDMEEISSQDVTNALRTAYVPQNMTLIVVGNFERLEMIRRIDETFGTMIPAPSPSLRVVTPPEPTTGPASVASTLSPFLGSNASVSVAFRTVGRDHGDAGALIVLGAYLNEKFYEQLRVKAGLSYAPEATLFFQPDYGILYVTADAHVNKLNRVHDLMIHIIEAVRRDKIAAPDVERTKNKILLQWAQGFETNAGLASFYAEQVAGADHRGWLRTGERPALRVHYEREVAGVSREDLDRVITRYLRPEVRADIRSAPTMTYVQFFGAVAGGLAVFVIVAVRRLHKAKKLRKQSPPLYLRR